MSARIPRHQGGSLVLPLFMPQPEVVAQLPGAADQLEANPSDREIARNIRASIRKDKSLSTYAHNVKIISQAGKVTLKGPVRSWTEASSSAFSIARCVTSMANTMMLSTSPATLRMGW